MKFSLKFLILIFFFINVNIAKSDDRVAFIDLDLVLKNSNIGLTILKELDQINNNNIQKLQIKEKELKKNENEIKAKQNIISEQEFSKEVDLLRERLKKFRSLRDKIISDFELKKNASLKKFFIKINPIIQEYMEKNSIDILLDRKNVFIGKNKSDITNIIIDEVNKNFN